MSSKNISIREDTYEKLRARKRGDESFTEVLERLLAEEKDFEAGFGAWTDSDAGAAARATRAEMNETFEERFEQGSESE